MQRVAILIYAGVETEADRGRLFNGLEAAASLSESVTDEVRVVFDGAGTKWVPKLEDPSHEFHSLYESVENVTACPHCVRNYGVEEQVTDAGVTLLRTENDGTSVVSLLRDEYKILTF